eukprot:1225907-Rhodomonas_salina.1
MLYVDTKAARALRYPPAPPPLPRNLGERRAILQAAGEGREGERAARGAVAAAGGGARTRDEAGGGGRGGEHEVTSLLPRTQPGRAS